MADLLKNVFGGSQDGQPAAKADSGMWTLGVPPPKTRTCIFTVEPDN